MLKSGLGEGGKEQKEEDKRSRRRRRSRTWQETEGCETATSAGSHVHTYINVPREASLSSCILAVFVLKLNVSVGMAALLGASFSLSIFSFIHFRGTESRRPTHTCGWRPSLLVSSYLIPSHGCLPSLLNDKQNVDRSSSFSTRASVSVYHGVSLFLALSFHLLSLSPVDLPMSVYLVHLNVM